MAENRQEEGQAESVQSRNTRLRESLSNANTALQAERTTQSFSAYTFEEALDAQIERIEGAGTQLRPNELDRVDRILSEVREAVDQIKSLPPESFIKPSSKDDVNTPENSADE
jgi:type VI protein secretion system component VasK